MPERALSEVHDAMSDDLKVLHVALHDVGTGADEPGCGAELMRAAHAMCPSSRGMPGNIEVALPVRGHPLVEA